MRSPVQTARELRQRMTAEEKLLWQLLRAHKFGGYKFRRQHPIIYQVWEKRTSFYVADFYCGLKKLVIELDGKPHEFPDQKEYDNARDKLMQEFGMKILRIKNDELKNMTNVLRKIEEALD
jgi:very-short-patch-repair endonuclease